MYLHLVPLLCLMSVYVTARELTQPLALPPKESPLLRSRKRISSTKQTNNSAPAHRNSQAKHSRVGDVCLDEPMLEQNFVTARSKVRLDCKPDKMNLSLNFTEPFRGLISIGQQPTMVGDSRQREPWCSVRGDGSLDYVLRLPLNKCLTRFDEKKGHFTNTLSVRYHPSLETGEDYSKTLLCKFGLPNLSAH